MSETLDSLETRKDTIQVAVESGATHIGSIVGIVVGAVRDVSRELGEWATDMFEMRDAARRARADAELRSELETETESPPIVLGERGAARRASASGRRRGAWPWRPHGVLGADQGSPARGRQGRSVRPSR